MDLLFDSNNQSQLRSICRREARLSTLRWRARARDGRPHHRAAAAVGECLLELPKRWRGRVKSSTKRHPDDAPLSALMKSVCLVSHNCCFHFVIWMGGPGEEEMDMGGEDDPFGGEDEEVKEEEVDEEANPRRAPRSAVCVFFPFFFVFDFFTLFCVFFVSERESRSS